MIFNDICQVFPLNFLTVIKTCLQMILTNLRSKEFLPLQVSNVRAALSSHVRRFLFGADVTLQRVVSKVSTSQPTTETVFY